MKKLALVSAALLFASTAPVFAQEPVIQDPIVASANAEYQSLQLQMQHFATSVGALATEAASAQAQLRQAEAEKATLIEWLKAAQAGKPAEK